MSLRDHRIAAVAAGIPRREYQAWRAQRNNAKRRNVPFLFDIYDWWMWWQIMLAERGPDAQRGLLKHQYVMARKGDKGAYEPDNVMCIHPADNQRDRDPVSVAFTVKAMHAGFAARGMVLGGHLKIRGDGHPRSKAVVTPLGRFGSIALAGEAHGITRQAGHYRVRYGKWCFE